MERKLSFWDVIREYKIEIPVIQRDYAQGRENSKAEDVRQAIVKKMANALREPDSDKLFFDFMYGRIDGDKFIPFDGQQRLTTLFLLHKYVFEKCLNTSAICCECNLLNALKRFSYATRQSSREFCQAFVEKDIFPAEGSCKTLSDFIKDQSWFFPDWEKDPTIMGMLVMLDEIDAKLKGERDFNAIAEKLTSPCHCPITFHFVDMGKLELPDDIYVKMNARGKKLTPFENFKASLEEYLDAKASSDDDAKNLLARIKKSIDVEWLDLFWKVANPDDGKDEKNLPDSLMLGFVNRYFLNVWQQRHKQDKSVKSDPEEQERLGKIEARINSEKDFPAYPSNDSFVSWDIYEGVLNQCKIEDCLIPIFNLWDDIWNHENQSVREEVVEACQPVWYRTDGAKNKWDLFNGDKRNNIETYPSRVAFYALLRFFARYDKSENDMERLSVWMRIVWNIIDNSTIDSSETYCDALNLIHELSDHCLDILSFLSEVSTGGKLIRSGFAGDQVREECLKAYLIETAQDKDHATELINAIEGDKLFKGRIISLMLKWRNDGGGNIAWDKYCFEDSGNSKVRITNDDLVDLPTLQTRHQKICDLFKPEKPRDEIAQMIGTCLLGYSVDNHDYCIDLRDDTYLFINSENSLSSFLHYRRPEFYADPVIIFSMFLDGESIKNNISTGKRDWRYYCYNYFLDNIRAYRYRGLSERMLKIEALPGDGRRSTHYSPFLDAIANSDNERYSYYQGQGRRKFNDGHIHFNDDSFEMWLGYSDETVCLTITAPHPIEIEKYKASEPILDEGRYRYTIGFEDNGDNDIVMMGREVLRMLENKAEQESPC